ncbi:MAG: class I lanthipeptide [Bacteroidota bacterium]
MKKGKIQGKLSLDKMTVAKLNDDQANEVVGGKGILSIGKKCTKVNGGCSTSNQSKGIWCPKNN